ncbi:MAG: F0F1 ATP synthase subunit delta [Minisyncoccota bacterium]
MRDTYTRLLEAVAETGDSVAADAAITKLVVHLKSTGRMNTLPKIAHELRTVAARRHLLRARVEVAHAREAEEALRAAAELGIKAEIAEINPSLISGWRAHGCGTLIDRSAKSALIQIYQQITV